MTEPGPAIHPGAVLAVVIGATGLGPLSMNILIPSMPGLQHVFDAGYGTVQLTLTLYLIGLAGAQLVHGPLSDRFGRRPVMLVGLALNLAGSTICLLAPHIFALVAGRFIQAVGGCVGLVVGRAIIRDLYDRRRTASLLAYVTMAMVVAPMLAPMIGGHLDVWFGWRAPSAFVLAAGVLVFGATLRWLPETLPARGAAPGFASIPLDFAFLLKRRTFLGYALTVSATSVSFLSFVSGGTYVTVELLGGTPGDYGFYFIPVAGCYMGGNFLSARLTMRLGVDRMITFGSVIILAAGCTMMALPLVGAVSMATMFATMGLVSFGHGFCIPNGLAGAVSVDHTRAGAAAGLAGAMQMGIGAVASVIVGAAMVDSAFPMAIGVFVGAVGTGAAHLWGVLLAPRAAAVS